MASLCEAGVKDAVISPGSRSTPLVWAASRAAGLSCHVIIDERSAGFFALGQARISGLPSVLICTSGSALSHYFPAVIEARQSGTPMLVLSADRPFELTHSGAHQTIDQTRIFGEYARYFELGTPVPEVAALLGLRRTAWQAVDATLSAPRGAVHLNFRAKKPLEPQLAKTRVELPARTALPPLRSPRTLGVARAELDWVLAALEASECPLLICGATTIHDAPAPELVAAFLDRTGAILWPEAVSQLRFQAPRTAAHPLVCDTGDWLLESAALGARLRPDFVLQLGAAPVSAALGRLLENGTGGLRHAICAESGWPDPLHKSAQLIRTRPAELLLAISEAWAGRAARGLGRMQLWRAAQRSARSVIDAHISSQFGEASAVASVVAGIPRGSVLALGNSLPPRLVDRYCPAAALGVRICSQRGASGIEGAIAGALGAASQTETPTTLLVGDISFLHDVGSLWASQAEHTLAPRARQPIVLVVLNNGGGRIFEELPIAAQPDIDIRYWTTPHDLNLRGAAELYGVPFARATNQAELCRALEAGYARRGVSLVEVVVDASSARRSLLEVRALLEARFTEPLELESA